jgi:hypothetical protein
MIMLSACSEHGDARWLESMNKKFRSYLLLDWSASTNVFWQTVGLLKQPAQAGQVPVLDLFPRQSIASSSLA